MRVLLPTLVLCICGSVGCQAYDTALYALLASGGDANASMDAALGDSAAPRTDAASEASTVDVPVSQDTRIDHPDVTQSQPDVHVTEAGPPDVVTQPDVPATGCGLVCSSSQSYCSGSCANTSSDPQFCGGCGTVCARGQVCSSGSCVSASTDPAHFNFESGSQSWTVALANHAQPDAGSLSLSSGSVSYNGGHSLAADITLTSAQVSASQGMYPIYISVNQPPVPACSIITFHLYIPAGAPIDYVTPYLLDQGWAWKQGVGLVSGVFPHDDWATLSFPLQTDVSTPINELGLQIGFVAAWTGTIYVDSVSW